MIHHFVYMLTSPSGKMYIGIHSGNNVEERWGKDGKNYKKYLIGDAIKKYHWKNFNKCYWEVESRDDACQCEKSMILFFNTKAPYGYNLTDGGDDTLGITPWNKGMKMPPEFGQKISKILTGKKQSPESIAKRAKSNTGKKRSDETRQKISKGNSGKVQSDEQRKIISITTKAGMTADVCAKMSKGRKAYLSVEENRNKFVESHIKIHLGVSEKEDPREYRKRRKRLFRCSIWSNGFEEVRDSTIGNWPKEKHEGWTRSNKFVINFKADWLPEAIKDLQNLGFEVIEV